MKSYTITSASLPIQVALVLFIFCVYFGTAFADVPPVPENVPTAPTTSEEDIPPIPSATLPTAPVSIPTQATNPSPTDGTQNIDLTTTLSWTQGNDTTSNVVYFGTNASLDESTYRGNQTGTTYTPDTLLSNTTYYWRIDEVNDAGTTTGTVWSFTTKTNNTTVSGGGNGGGGGSSSRSGGGGGGGSKSSSSKKIASATVVATPTPTLSVKCSSATLPATDAYGQPTLSGIIDLFVALGIIPPDRAARACEALTSMADNTLETTSTQAFTKLLSLGMTDPEVTRLQVFLNTHGFPIAVTGPGSNGQESSYYGIKTSAAVAQFQKTYRVGLNSMGYFGTETLQKVNQLLKK